MFYVFHRVSMGETTSRPRNDNRALDLSPYPRQGGADCSEPYMHQTNVPSTRKAQDIKTIYTRITLPPDEVRDMEQRYAASKWETFTWIPSEITHRYRGVRRTVHLCEIPTCSVHELILVHSFSTPDCSVPMDWVVQITSGIFRPFSVNKVITNLPAYSDACW